MNNISRLNNIKDAPVMNPLSYVVEAAIKIGDVEYKASGAPSNNADAARTSAVDTLFKNGAFALAVEGVENNLKEAKRAAERARSSNPDFTETMFAQLNPSIKLINDSETLSVFVNEEIKHADENKDCGLIGLDTEGRKKLEDGQKHKQANIMQLCGFNQTVVFRLDLDTCSQVQRLIDRKDIKLAVVDSNSEKKALSTMLNIDADRLSDVQPLAHSLVHELRRDNKNPSLLDIASFFTKIKMQKLADRKTKDQRKEVWDTFDNVTTLQHLDVRLIKYAGVDAAATKWAYIKLIELKEEKDRVSSG
jgi:hypothetical protein